MLYAGTMKCPSKQVADQLNVMQRGFIWSNKKPKIKHSTSVADYSKEGHKDIDIKTKLSALKVARVTRLLVWTITFILGKLSQQYCLPLLAG